MRDSFLMTLSLRELIMSSNFHDTVAVNYDFSFIFLCFVFLFSFYNIVMMPWMVPFLRFSDDSLKTSFQEQLSLMRKNRLFCDVILQVSINLFSIRGKSTLIHNKSEQTQLYFVCEKKNN